VIALRVVGTVGISQRAEKISPVFVNEYDNVAAKIDGKEQTKPLNKFGIASVALGLFT
jgi:hypothetical protein